MNTAYFRMAVAMLLGFVVPVVAEETDGPTYQGRTAQSWASDLTRGELSMHYSRDQPEEAFEAFREIGTAAVPVLVKKLEDNDRMVRHNAAQALMLMGIAARDAVPALIRARARGESKGTHHL